MANNNQYQGNRRNNGQNNQNKKNNQQNQQASKENPVDTATKLIVDKESRTCTFTKSFQIHGLNKTGTFVAKYPTITDRIAIGSIRAKMLNGAPAQSVDKYTDDLAFMMAYLKILLIKAPKWYDFTTMEDDNLLTSVYYEVSNWVINFRQSDESGEDDGNSTSADDEEDMEGNEAVSGSN